MRKFTYVHSSTYQMLVWRLCCVFMQQSFSLLNEWWYPNQYLYVLFVFCCLLFFLFVFFYSEHNLWKASFKLAPLIMTVIPVRFSSVQFSLDPWSFRSSRGHKGQFSRDPLPFFFLICRRPLLAVLAWAEMSTLWFCSSSISSANHGVTHPPGYPKGWFWRGCCGIWRARTKFPSPDSCQKRFSWMHKEVNLVPHPVIGLVL